MDNIYMIGNGANSIYVYGNLRFDPEDMPMPYYEFNTTKLKSLGLKFKSVQEMFDDCIASLVEKSQLGQV